MIHYFHVPYQDVDAMPMHTVWRLMRQLPKLLGVAPKGDAAAPQTQEEKQAVFINIMEGTEAHGTKGPRR
jgi:hypothetical protein